MSNSIMTRAGESSGNGSERVAATGSASVGTKLPVPPALGDGQNWGIRVVEWYERNERDLKNPRYVAVMVPNGTAVHEDLHSYYWEAQANYDKILAAWIKAGKPMPHEFLLINNCDRIVGGGLFAPTNGSHEMAWLNCMFAEMHGWRVSVLPPDGLTDEELAALGQPAIVTVVEQNSEGDEQ
jgi:hypothetical protein